jgi:uncharacterized membrane protein YkoI
MKMLKNFAWPLMLCVAVGIAATPAFAFTGQRFAREAKVSLEQARAAALKAYPGTITDQELEKERGGTGLRYSFDIKNGATTHEVGIDALTGRLLENSVEGPNAD